MKRVLALLAAAAIAVTGCSSSKASGSSGGSLTVYAAASLTETFTTLGKQFEDAHPGTHIVFNFGPSSTLATQIQQGAPVDVFASASKKNMDAVVKSGDASKPATFVTNTMEIAAAPGNPAHISNVADLAKRSVKVALCDPAVPCGAVAQKVFANAGLTVKATSLEVDVKSTLAKVELGEVDAGLVYVTDVKAAGSKVVGIPIPASVNASTAYPIAALTHAKNSALAAQFVAFIQSAAARAVFAGAGFSTP